jgi:hypothetical protein
MERQDFKHYPNTVHLASEHCPLALLKKGHISFSLKDY